MREPSSGTARGGGGGTLTKASLAGGTLTHAGGQLLVVGEGVEGGR